MDCRELYRDRDYSTGVGALVPRYREAFGSVTISVTPIPEFSSQVVLVSLLGVTVVSTRVLPKRSSRR